MAAIDIYTGELESFLPILPNTVELSTRLPNLEIYPDQLGTDYQWQAYLQSLAIAGFKQWLEDGAIALSGVPLRNNEPSNVPGINFRVGNHRLCIIAIGSGGESSVDVMIEQSAGSKEEAIAHLYILIEVQEELNQICVMAGLTRERIIQKMGLQSIRKGEPLHLPVSYFEVAPEEILLYLSCLEPAPQTSVRRSVATAVINAGCWLQGRMDELTEQLDWSLLPPLTTAMRPVRDSIANAMEVLSNQGIQLPLQAKGVSGPISIGTHTFQMCAWVWPIDNPSEEAEWSLFLLLGPQDGAALPEGVQLQVSDQTEILSQEVLAHTSSEAYLYTQVRGQRQEQFRVSIQLSDGMEMVLPMFGFGQP